MAFSHAFEHVGFPGTHPSVPEQVSSRLLLQSMTSCRSVEHFDVQVPLAAVDPTDPPAEASLFVVLDSAPAPAWPSSPTCSRGDPVGEHATQPRRSSPPTTANEPGVSSR